MRPSQHSVGMIFVTVGLLLWVAIWTQAIRGTREARVLDMTFPVLFTAICLAFTIRARRADVRTSETAIELQTFLRRRVLPIRAIRGRRTYVNRGDESADVWHLVLVSGDDRFPSLDIADLYIFDESFRAWFHSLPDLDAGDKSLPKTSNFCLV
jgi:hypothetical protein